MVLRIPLGSQENCCAWLTFSRKEIGFSFGESIKFRYLNLLMNFMKQESLLHIVGKFGKRLKKYQVSSKFVFPDFSVFLFFIHFLNVQNHRFWWLRIFWYWFLRKRKNVLNWSVYGWVFCIKSVILLFELVFGCFTFLKKLNSRSFT